MGPSPFKKDGLARVKLLDAGVGVIAGRQGAPGIHVYTQSEYEAVAADPYYRELDSAGETRIVPRATQVRIALGAIIHILRTRVRPPVPYNRHARGWVLALNTVNGQEVYVQEKYLEPVE